MMHQIDRPCTHTIDNTLGSTSMPLDRESQCSLQDRLLHKPMFHTTDAYACRLPPRTSSLSSLKQGILIACQIPRRHGSIGSLLNASLLHSCALRAALAQMHSVLRITGAGGCAPASHFLPKPFLPPAAIFGGDGGSTNAGSSSEPDSASEDGAAFPPVTELPAAGLGEPMKR